MNKRIILAFGALLAFAAAAYSQTSANVGAPTRVNIMGSNWGNTNKGGFYFYTASQPSGVDYFIIRPTDVGLEMFLSQILTAKARNWPLVISYTLASCGMTKCEADVSKIEVGP